MRTCKSAERPEPRTRSSSMVEGILARRSRPGRNSLHRHQFLRSPHHWSFNGWAACAHGRCGSWNVRRRRFVLGGHNQTWQRHPPLGAGLAERFNRPLDMHDAGRARRVPDRNAQLEHVTENPPISTLRGTKAPTTFARGGGGAIPCHSCTPPPKPIQSAILASVGRSCR